MKIRNIRLSNVTITNRPVVGESVFTTTGTYTWVCPPEVYNVSVVCIGPGAVAPDGVAMYGSENGGNGYTPGGGGGAGSGGALAWKNNIPVTPGNVYYVYNGTFNYAYVAGSPSEPLMSGSAFRIENHSNGGARYAVAAGGADILAPGTSPNKYRHSNWFIGEGGGLGGQSGYGGYGFDEPFSDGYGGFYQGGGGAGGYTGPGGHGGRNDVNAIYWEGANVGYGQPGSGGGGGGAGGGYDNAHPANSPAFTHLPSPLATIVAFGGGTGLYGQGDSGEGGSGTNLSANVLSPGGAGSGGMSHLYGGGIRVPNAYGITDSPGAVRIIWPGAIRKFPNTNTGEAGVVYSYNTNSAIPPTPASSYSIDYLIVGGGAGSGQGPTGGGGGGAGGLLQGSTTTYSGNTYTITVGAGGVAGGTNSAGPGTAQAGGTGGSSSFLALAAGGGGYGGSGNPGGSNPGGAGGSGGGGGGTNTTTPGGASSGAGTGNPGGIGRAPTHPAAVTAAGGGGGAGASGSSTSPTDNVGAPGGIGAAVSITGSSVYYAGGGGGAISGFGSVTRSSGGLGGGGQGGYSTYNSGPTNQEAFAGSSGIVNTGGGGGGGFGYVGRYSPPLGSTSNVNGAGGSGVVVIRHSNVYTAASVTGNTTIRDILGNYVYTFYSSGTIQWSQ